MHHKTSNALQVLDQMDAIQYDIYALAASWKQSLQHAKDTGGIALMDLELTISGPMAKSQVVGRVLSKAGLYLQHPRFLSHDMPYDNPHYIRFSDYTDQPPEFHASSTTLKLEDIKPQALAIDSVFENLDQRGHLKAIHIDKKFVTTELQRYLIRPKIRYAYLVDRSFSYQREAVDFIIQREAFKTPPAFSLWKPHIGDRDRNWYATRNLINCIQLIIII